MSKILNNIYFKIYYFICVIFLRKRIIELYEETDMLIDEDTFVETPSYLQYWKEVKQELEKLKNK